MHICAYAGELRCGGYVYVFFDHFSPYFVRQELPLNPEFIDWLALLPRGLYLSLDSPPHTHTLLGLQVCTTVSGFHVGANDPNSGSPVVKAGILSTELSLWPKRDYGKSREKLGEVED